MAWFRAMGGVRSSKILLSPLGQLAQSTVKWVHNTYFNGIANTGTSTDATSGYLVSVDANNIATFRYAYGFSVGFVTNCEASKTYTIQTSGTRAKIYVLFYNDATLVSSVDSANDTFSFTVPSNVTNVVLVPTGSAAGNFTIGITSFSEN